MDPTAAFMIDRIVAAGMARRDEIVGCTDEEIRALEVIHEVRLPKSYRGFLSAMGRDAGRIFSIGEGYGFHFNSVKYLNWEIRFTHDFFWPRRPMPVPESAFFIGTFQSMDYWYIDLAGGSDDPPVWGYGESWGTDEDESHVMGTRQVAASVWELVEHELEYRVEMHDRLARLEKGLPEEVENPRLLGLRRQWDEYNRRCEIEKSRNPDEPIPF